MRGISRFLSVLVILVLVTSACGGEANSPTSVAATTPAAPVTATAAPTTGIASTTTPTTTVASTTTEPLTTFENGSMDPGQQKAYMFLTESDVEIEYFLYLPIGYNEDRVWPLIVFLHGFVGFDDPNLESIRVNNPLAWVGPDVEFPFVLIAPLGPAGRWSLYHDPMEELIDELAESLAINTEAVFLTGLSTGATGTWQWALARPERFAGIAAIAGSPTGSPTGPPPEDICALQDLPVWVAHSAADSLSIASDAATVEALNECGSSVVTFTIYQELSHAESLIRAYAGPELYQWMLQQTD